MILHVIFCLIFCRLSWHDFGVRQWRIDGTIFVTKNAPLTEGGKKLPIFGTKLVAKTATMQFGSPKGGMLWMLNISQPQNEKGSG
ncbi:hypothetical protein KI810_02690 [Geobacter luticola]|uniref:Uncharacterized protein n=1 Tax=Geomobilimonas luticola TaxID=1114878 RepID=A0ABS5S995_9BACT|nr:hypothetical protein [Geomobilimonas luticola]